MTVTFRLKAADSSSSCSLDRRFLLADLRPVFKKRKKKKKQTKKKRCRSKNSISGECLQMDAELILKYFFLNKFKKKDLGTDL